MIDTSNDVTRGGVCNLSVISVMYGNASQSWLCNDK
jgi:hypothetical protein